jgi:hypothetical protein
LFRTFAPKLYKHYQDHTHRLLERHPDLRKDMPFLGYSVYPSCTFNFGNAVSGTHLDPSNVPYGYCDIASLGPFDPTKGGHIVLWDLNMIIEFPAGAHILIPSAILYHSNTTLHTGDTRYSFTQYCAGPLFRWVDAGFGLLGQLKGDKKTAFEDLKKGRNEDPFQLLPTLDSLL